MKCRFFTLAILLVLPVGALASGPPCKRYKQFVSGNPGALGSPTVVTAHKHHHRRFWAIFHHHDHQAGTAR